MEFLNNVGSFIALSYILVGSDQFYSRHGIFVSAIQEDVLLAVEVHYFS